MSMLDVRGGQVEDHSGLVSAEVSGRPKLRGTTAAFASRLFGAHVTKTNARESLVIASFIRGLSVRDAGATLADALGDQAAISRPAVSAVCQAIKGEYEARAQRRLDGITLDYLFPGASFFRMHPGSPASRAASPPTASPPASAWPPAPASPSTPGTVSRTT
jgi:putative transposase